MCVGEGGDKVGREEAMPVLPMETLSCDVSG